MSKAAIQDPSSRAPAREPRPLRGARIRAPSLGKASCFLLDRALTTAAMLRPMPPPRPRSVPPTPGLPIPSPARSR